MEEAIKYEKITMTPEGEFFSVRWSHMVYVIHDEVKLEHLVEAGRKLEVTS